LVINKIRTDYKNKSSAQTTVMIYVGNMSRSGHQLPTELRNWQESQLKQNFIKNTPSEYGRKTR